MITNEDLIRVKEDRGPNDLERQIGDLTKQKTYLQSKCREAGATILDLEFKIQTLIKDLDRVSEEGSKTAPQTPRLITRVSMKLSDRQPVELFSKIFESSLRYNECKTITPEPYRKEYIAKTYKSEMNSKKAKWFTKNVYPYLIKEDKKDFAVKVLGNRPESKDLAKWTKDELIHYLATAIEGDGSIQVHNKNGRKALRIDMFSSDPQYLSNIVTIGADKLNLVSRFKKISTYLTQKGLRTKYRLFIFCSKTNPNNLNFLESLLKHNVMTLDRKKERVQEFVTWINSKGEKEYEQESRV